MAAGKDGKQFMVRCLLSFIFVFLMISTFSFAKPDELVKLQKKYGYNLTKAPFFLRFAFHKEFNKDWKKSEFPERKAFLIDYEANLAKDQKKEREEAKEEADKEKELSLEKKEELRKENERLKAQHAQEKSEQEANQERQKDFNDGISQQEKYLQQMRREITQPQTAN